MISDSALARGFWEDGKVADCPVIDVHGHMGRMNGIWFPRETPEAMLRTMDECGMTSLWFSHHEGLTSLERRNSSGIDAVRKYPDRFKLYLIVHPGYPELLQGELDLYEEHKDVCIGFKIHPDAHRTHISDSAYDPMFEFAQERGLAVLSHTWGEAQWSNAEHILKLMEKYPNLTLLLGHSIFGQWKEACEITRSFPNVYLDTTAQLDDRGSLEIFVGEGLSERLLFGTDLPWFSPHNGIGAILSAEISDDDRRNILYRNAEKLLASLP